MTRRFFAAMTAALVMFMFGGCSGERPENGEKLKIGTNIWPGYEPLYLARENGVLDSEQFQLVEYTSASDVIRSYRNGLINAAALTMDEALLLQAQNFDVKIVLVLDISEGADVIVAQNGITSMAGLKGKKIGVEDTALGAYVLSRALDLSSISFEDIHVVSLEVSEHEEALKSGLVDAVVTFEPVRSKLLSSGANEVFNSRQIPGEVVDVLVVDANYAEHNREAVESLIDAWSKARQMIADEPVKSARIMGMRQGVSAEEFLSSLEGLHLPTLDENRAYFKGAESTLYKNSLKLLDVLQRKGLIENRSVDTKSMFIPGWLQE